MLRDHISLGSAPYDVEPAQVGSDDYTVRARIECRAYINQLRRQFGKEPGSALITIKTNVHDYGVYYDVICYYDHRSEVEVEYAFKLEREGPAEWDKEAIEELALAESYD